MTVILADLNDEIAAEFNLEPQAVGELVERVKRLIAEQPGGFEGFLENFKASGHVLLGSAYAPLTVRQVKKLMGTPVIKEVAKYLEIPQGFASKVLGTAIPRIVGPLAAQSSSPVAVPPDALAFPTFFARAHWRDGAGDASKERNSPLRMDVRYVARLRFRVLVATLLVTGISLGYGISPRASSRASAAAGLVNGANIAAVTCPLVPEFGTREITRDFAVWPRWTKNLTAAFGCVDSGSSRSLAAGNINILNTKRTIPEADDSARTIDSSQSSKLLARAGDSAATPTEKTYVSDAQPASTSRTMQTHATMRKRRHANHQRGDFRAGKQHS
jgi:hypothetical protein